VSDKANKWLLWKKKSGKCEYGLVDGRAEQRSLTKVTMTPWGLIKETVTYMP